MASSIRRILKVAAKMLPKVPSIDHPISAPMTVMSFTKSSFEPKFAVMRFTKSSFEPNFAVMRFTKSSFEPKFAVMRFTKSSFERKPNYYRDLLLNDGATSCEVKSAYYRLMKSYHPDKNSSVEAKIRFLEVQTAYKELNQRAKSLPLLRLPAPAKPLPAPAKPANPDPVYPSQWLVVGLIVLPPLFPWFVKELCRYISYMAVTPCHKNFDSYRLCRNINIQPKLGASKGWYLVQVFFAALGQQICNAVVTHSMCIWNKTGAYVHQRLAASYSDDQD